MQLAEFRLTQLRDATALRNAELKAVAISTQSAQVAEREALLRRAQEAGQIGSFEIDIPSNTMTVTEEFCRILGMPFKSSYEPEAFERQVLPDDKSRASDAKERQEGQFALHTEYRFRRLETGETIWVSRRARLIRVL